MNMAISAYSINNFKRQVFSRAFVSLSIEYLHLPMSTGGIVVAFPIRPLLENMLHAYKSRSSLVQ